MQHLAALMGGAGNQSGTAVPAPRLVRAAHEFEVEIDVASQLDGAGEPESR